MQTRVHERVRCLALKTPLFSADGRYATEEGQPDAFSGPQRVLLSPWLHAGACVCVTPGRLPSEARCSALLPLMSNLKPYSPFQTFHMLLLPEVT